MANSIEKNDWHLILLFNVKPIALIFDIDYYFSQYGM